MAVMVPVPRMFLWGNGEVGPYGRVGVPLARIGTSAAKTMLWEHQPAPRVLRTGTGRRVLYARAGWVERVVLESRAVGHARAKQAMGGVGATPAPPSM